MARVPLIDPDSKPELAGFAAEVRKLRRGRVINVYRLLLHSPPLAETWFAHNNAVRWSTGLDGRLREMVIIRIAYVTGVPYVIGQHVPKLALAEGLTLNECEALKDWEPSTFFNARDRAVLAYTDAMTRDVRVPEEIFAPLRKHFGDRELVELTVLIGTYAMHVRVFQALELDPEPQAGP